MVSMDRDLAGSVFLTPLDGDLKNPVCVLRLDRVGVDVFRKANDATKLS